MNLQIVDTINVSGGPWSDYRWSVPLTDIRNAIRKMAAPQRKPSEIWLPFDVALILAEHPGIQDATRYIDPANLDSLGLPPTLRGLKVGVFEDSGGDVVVGFEDGSACAIRGASPGTLSPAFEGILS